MGNVTLDEDQRERAITLYERLKDDEIHHPTDFLHSWEKPEDTFIYSSDDEPIPQEREYIDPSKIEGALGDTSRLEVARLVNVLVWLVEGDFEQERTAPPMVQKRGNRYYVTDDGHHRAMAAKAVGLDRLYAVVGKVPPDRLE